MITVTLPIWLIYTLILLIALETIDSCLNIYNWFLEKKLNRMKKLIN